VRRQLEQSSPTAVPRGKQKVEATEASGSQDPKKKKKGRKLRQGQQDENLVAVVDLKNTK